MAAIYGHRWTSAYSDDVASMAGDTWAVGLAGMTPAQLGRGLTDCARSADAWPPSLPAFRALCLGIPALGDVIRELRPGHPAPSDFARFVQLQLDPYALRQADARAERAMISDAYDFAARVALEGNAIPKSRLAIANDETAEREHYDAEHWRRFS